MNESADRDTQSKLFADAHANVMNFISGRRGRAVILEMFQLVRSFANEGWHGLSISDDVKFQLCEAMLSGMADSFHRLVFILLDPRWKLFGVCESTSFDSALVKHIVDPLLALMRTCDRCKDVYFAEPWLRRLSDDDERIRSKAHRCLTSVVPTLAVSAVRCEKKHLLGSETRAQKRRGKALACKTLMKVTYSKSVYGGWKRARAIVLAKHCGGKVGKRKFGQALGHFRIQNDRRRTGYSRNAGKLRRRVAGAIVRPINRTRKRSG